MACDGGLRLVSETLHGYVTGIPESMFTRGFAIYGPQTLITMTGVETVGPAALPSLATGVIRFSGSGAAQGCCNCWRPGQQSRTACFNRLRGAGLLAYPAQLGSMCAGAEVEGELCDDALWC